jgi:hypothetical protein
MSHPHQRGSRPAGDSQTQAAERRLRRRVAWLLTAALIPVVAALVVGAVVLWPNSTLDTATLVGVTGDAKGTSYVAARTDQVTPFACQGIGSGPGTTVKCAHVTVTLTSGPEAPTREDRHRADRAQIRHPTGRRAAARPVPGHRRPGLLLAGVIVASLGILNDVTVTQASAVWELRDVSPDATPGRLFRGAMRIGRDHIASTVYTIVFAYAGAALPVLLLIDLSQRPLGAIVTGEAIGEELVRTLVGAMGLVLSVPLTTAVGVALVRFARGSSTHPPDRDGARATSGSAS